MGKKKAFIDKKKAVSYSLVYRDPAEEEEGEDGGQRVLAPTGGHRGAQQASDDYNDDYQDDGSLYESEYSLAMSRDAAAHHDGSYALTEERRRELLSLGFPDDGYDYLNHLRDLGRGRHGAAGRGGVAPIPEDQELDGFEEKEEEEEEDGDFGGEGEGGEDDEEDFTIYDTGDDAGPSGPGPAAGSKGTLDAAALAAAAVVEAAAAAAAAAAAGPSTSTGNGAAGPGPSSVRAAAAAAAAASVRGGGGGVGSARARSVAASARAAGTARSMASTARTQGSGVGPSVYVAAARLLPPKPDVRVVDARRLVVKPKGQDEAAAAAALSDVSALARPTELHGHRGKLYQDLDEVEKSIAALESGIDPNRAEVVEGDEWADWLDEFVAGTGDDDGAAAAGAAGTTGGVYGGVNEEEDEGEAGGGESEEPEEEEEDGDEWRNRHRRNRQQEQEGQGQGAEAGPSSAAAGAAAAGPGAGVGARTAALVAGSVASSFWRAERRDRKQGLEALDARFERLAVEYDDEEIGDLEDERYADHDDDDEEGDRLQRPTGQRPGAGGRGPHQGAAGNCEISDFADVLDEFLQEHRAAEALEEEGLRPLKPTDDVTLQASRPDPEALAATRERMRRQLEAAAAEEQGPDGGAAAGVVTAAEPKRTIMVQEAERWDCESILSLTSNLENHPGKIVEPQRRTGGRGGGLIRLSTKTGMPVTAAAAGSAGRGPAGTIPEESEEDDEEEAGSGGSEDGDEAAGSAAGVDPALLERRKGETAEERRARKAAVKDARRSQRTAKKEMKNMFRQQASRAQKQAAGRSQAAGSTYVIP